jgi:hypothetical protein
MADQYIENPLTQELLQRWGIQNPADIGVRNVTQQNEATNETYTLPQYYNTKTGTDIGLLGGYLGAEGTLTKNPKGEWVASYYDMSNMPNAQQLGVLAAGLAGMGALGAFGDGLGAAGAAGTTAETGALSGLSASQIANLAKAGISVAGLLGGANAVSNAVSPSGISTGTSAPTSQPLSYTPDYYSQLQQYYNKYLPGQPADVVSNLADWYGAGLTQPSATPLTPSTASAMLRMGTFTPEATQQVQGLSVADKAKTYNDLMTAGLTDPAIRNIVETQMGVQTPQDWQYLQNAAQLQTVSASTDPLVKAQEYNTLVSQGLSDDQIRSLVEASVGSQTNTDWNYLKQLAASI